MRPNLVVIRSEHIESLAEFYSLLGCEFEKHRHGKGPEHYAYVANGVVFEIYPRAEGERSTVGVRIGFEVDSVDEAVKKVVDSGKGKVISEPKDSTWGRR